MSFAAIETEINAACLAAFTNRASATVDGITLTRFVFDANYVESLGMESSGPALSALTSEVATAIQGSPVIIDGEAYKVINAKPDGTGITVLRLHKA